MQVVFKRASILFPEHSFPAMVGWWFAILTIVPKSFALDQHFSGPPPQTNTQPQQFCTPCCRNRGHQHARIYESYRLLVARPIRSKRRCTLWLRLTSSSSAHGTLDARTNNTPELEQERDALYKGSSQEMDSWVSLPGIFEGGRQPSPDNKLNVSSRR